MRRFIHIYTNRSSLWKNDCIAKAEEYISEYGVHVSVKGKRVNLVPSHEDVLGEWRYSSTH